MLDTMRDPYKALGVDTNSSDAEIKKAYRRLAKDFHPDRTGGDKSKEARFKDISAAYEILSDPKRRAQFDNAASGGSIPMGDLSEIFAQMFGGGMGGGRRGARVNTHFGGSPFGGGNGSPFGGSPFGGGGGSPFGGMGGSPFGGQQQQRRQAPAPAPKPAAPKEKTVKASDGSELTQRGANIYSDLRIPFDRAILGTVAKVPTLKGVAQVRIPAGTSSGQKLRLKEQGATKTNSSAKSSHGDHFVTVHIDVPKLGGEESGELLAKLVESLRKEKA